MDTHTSRAAQSAPHSLEQQLIAVGMCPSLFAHHAAAWAPRRPPILANVSDIDAVMAATLNERMRCEVELASRIANGDASIDASRMSVIVIDCKEVTQ